MFDIPDYKKIRVIVDTDAACEADDPYAIVHALLSPKLIVKGICAEHFVEEGSMQRSYEEICTIINAMEADAAARQDQGEKDGKVFFHGWEDYLRWASPSSGRLEKTGVATAGGS